MTTTMPTSNEAPAEETAGQVAGRRWRASRGILFVVLALAALIVVLAALRPHTRTDSLDPTSTSPEGSRALAEIVRQHGTPVSVVRSASAAATQLQQTPDSVLVVVRSERLTSDDREMLNAAPGDRLLVAPNETALQSFAPDVKTTGSASGALDPDCTLTAATYAGDADLFNATTFDGPPDAVHCYRSALLQTQESGATVTLLGSGDPLTNERLRDHGNAALGMNLIGARSNAIWLMPDLPPAGKGGDKSFNDLMPIGVKLGWAQLIVAVLLVAVWRARRLGPVVAEPLPVVVRSSEAVEGRARLYRSRGATGRAAAALRTGALERLTVMLGMPRIAATDPAMYAEIAMAVAARTGRDQAEIMGALFGPDPVDDGQLVWLADYLDDLERQVRSS